MEKKDLKQQERKLFYSEKFWKKTPEQIMEEAEEHQMKARAYEMEYHKQQENKKQP